MVIIYAVVTAFFGFRVGRQIHATQANPFSGPASQTLGASASESSAVQSSGLPWFITGSPAFWLALHAAE